MFKHFTKHINKKIMKKFLNTNFEKKEKYILKFNFSIFKSQALEWKTYG